MMDMSRFHLLRYTGRSAIQICVILDSKEFVFDWQPGFIAVPAVQSGRVHGFFRYITVNNR
jgi:hypothetical protein